LFETYIKKLGLIVVVFLFWGSPATAKHLGVVGATYQIAEPDALQEIKNKAAAVNWKKIVNKDIVTKKVKDFQPQDLRKLPTALSNRKFTVDLTYTLDQDIPDGKGGVLYPKGYTFNPLDYAGLRSVIVVINGSDPSQVNWFKNSIYFEDFKTRLILSDGSYYDLSEKFKRPVFYLMEPMANRFQLKAVPSVVSQKGRYLEVSEIYIPKDTSTQKTK